MAANILAVNDLDVKVDDQILISKASFNIPKGRLTCITGENGVGKTTLVKTILKQRFHPNQHVQFSIDPSLIQYVPQFRNIDDEYPLKVSDFITLGATHSLRPWLSHSERQRRKSVMQSTNLIKIKDEPLGRASGGEKQRAFLAQALMNEPQLLILDETTASLDQDAKVTLLKLVVEIMKKTQMAVMFITHDPSLIQKFGEYDLNIADHHAVMKRIGGDR